MNIKIKGLTMSGIVSPFVCLFDYLLIFVRKRQKRKTNVRRNAKIDKVKKYKKTLDFLRFS